ncbi:MAG: SPOR domain-containing protein [Thermodesulfobacteriota bacterium]|nr:SPOR domain-containing protein [Thermodesulfobacteriota bacterium]
MRAKKTYRFSFHKRLLILVLIGVVFAFTLIFTLGFFVGKDSEESLRSQKTVEESYEEDRLSRDFISKETGRDSTKRPSDMDLTFYETLIRKEAVAPSKTPARKTNYRTNGNKSNKKQEERKISKNKKKQARSLSGYTLQVGSFQDKARAQELEKRLKSKGYATYIISSNIPMKGVWHRVRIGHFHTLQEAKKTQLSVEMKERLPAYVTFISK